MSKRKANIDAHNLLLGYLDRAYSELRQYHENVHYVNSIAPEYQNPLQDLHDAAEILFEFKNIVHHIEKVSGYKNLTGLTSYTQKEKEGTL